jgi:hypothetical protein
VSRVTSPLADVLEALPTPPEGPGELHVLTLLLSRQLWKTRHGSLWGGQDLPWIQVEPPHILGDATILILKTPPKKALFPLGRNTYHTEWSTTILYFSPPENGNKISRISSWPYDSLFLTKAQGQAQNFPVKTHSSTLLIEKTWNPQPHCVSAALQRCSASSLTMGSTGLVSFPSGVIYLTKAQGMEHKAFLGPSKSR